MKMDFKDQGSILWHHELGMPRQSIDYGAENVSRIETNVPFKPK